ncbi:MAG: hypothetical protein A3I61_11705 [Acidobacteria bacterium RIFCSPLOWO2_02_FULL_68_18]|nr:MAG: hypothetical protein A3I61_11705 [Acidobacteria bacterium RIFCSPLOWO2_02_FULL_68_18]OFW50724.1 MAG: hypothetical protein A3G77_17455 [Acidobacteria bacterium RIFCSPLOWO2_12_FULL_68_19]
MQRVTAVDLPLAITILYVAGVVCGLLVSDARPLERVVLSLLWPLGPLAFVVTVTILLAASVVAYPLVMAPALAAIAFFLWWILA